MKFSIITVSFNQAPFLEQAIKSVIEQGCSDIQYIVVDAGSTDGSREIIERYRDRINKIILEPDEGPADGLNKGLSMSSGDVIGYLNSDDFLLPGSIAWARRFFDNHETVDVLVGGIKMADQDGSLAWRGRVSDAVELSRFAAHGLHYFQQGTFFRKCLAASVGGFNVANRTCWDLELVIDMALQGARIKTVSRPVAAFRVHEKSITSGGSYYRQYLTDYERLRQKVIAAGIVQPPHWLKVLYQLEHRWNPARILRQFYPVWVMRSER